MTSGGSLPQGVPSPQKVASLRPRASGLLAIAKSCGYFSGAPPSIPPCGFAVLVIPGKKAGFAPTGAVCRSCTLHACLYQGSPHPEGKPERFSRISSIRHRHLAGRVPRAKRLGRQRRNPGSRNLYMALFQKEPERMIREAVTPAPADRFRAGHRGWSRP